MINWPNCNSYDLPLIGFNQTAHVQGHCKCFVILIMATKITRYFGAHFNTYGYQFVRIFQSSYIEVR